jgi:glutamyl-tRNA synthetase
MTDTSGTPAGAVRVRFAPSPTGYLHVGGGRTALFNWLFARQQKGTMILRVEDTDAERNKPELVDGIIQGLTWLGVDWDEGPFYQSQRTELYRAAAKRLLANGSAFLCYCPPEKYVGGDHAEEGGGTKQARKVVRCSCRDGKPSSPDTKPAVRFKVPTGGTTKFVDAVFGEREFANDDIEDFVLLRSGKDGEEFGQAMYQLSVVADDMDMRVTHIIRGADHLSNTPKQVLLYNALGAKPPIFAHVPLILGTDKSRLSKRHGATDVNMYRVEGFLPEAFRNFLALLGWSPGGDEQFLRTSELLEKFSLEGVSRTNGVFDRAKLEWFNTQYLQKPDCGKRSGPPEPDTSGFRRRSICCGHGCGCCRTLRPGRGLFSAMNLSWIPRRRRNSGRTKKCLGFCVSWRMRWRHYPSGTTMRAIMPRGRLRKRVE